jgi:hypothetical protein
MRLIGFVVQDLLRKIQVQLYCMINWILEIIEYEDDRKENKYLAKVFISIHTLKNFLISFH